MPVENKKASGKQQPVQPVQPVAPAAKQITIQLSMPSLDFTGPGFQLKLAVLGIAILLFGFSLFLFARSNLALSDAFDYSRLEFNSGKLYSLNFILFLVLYSLCMGMLVSYGHKASKFQAALPLVASLIIAGLLGVFMPSYSIAFIGFALALGAAAFAASFYSDLTPSNIWSITSRALTVLVIVAFLFTFMKVSADKDKYFGVMVSGVASQAPELVASAAPAGAQKAVEMCADLIGVAQIKRDQVEKVFVKEEFATALEQSGGAVYSALPANQKQSIVDGAYDYSLEKSVEVAGKLQTDLSKYLRTNSKALASQISTSNVTSAITPEMISGQLKNLPQGRILLDYFPLLAAFTVAGILSIVNLFIHVLATVFAWAIAKFVL